MQLFDLDGADGRELLDRDGSARLWTHYLDAVEHEELFGAICDGVRVEQRRIVVAGRTVDQPRLDAWIGDPGAAYTYSGTTVAPQPWTAMTKRLRDRLSEWFGTEFNAVLLNVYRDGRDSMGFHADDEPELGGEPTIASLSLGATRRLRFRHRTDDLSVAVDLPGGSLLVMSGACQQKWLHGVARTSRPVGTRINLTFRRILTSEPSTPG